ncbi:Casein kinase, putative [Hondaea fermentalgiana]|uniref:Casein kinase I n=1 Tax=Hondaea fermentalgiana TaxID=2315210 RepID=A0A2R5GU68_9STRA|nr:Casein kinase, putative [Hondaea fermentalgiana]|eukprot:GBG34416.1 Casein kinase, putative [Hondaea fermentalgiana]
MESRPSVSRLVRAAREAAEIRAKEEASATDDTSEAHGASKAARDPEEEEKELERTKVKAELLRANSFVNRLPPRLQQELACAAKVRIVHEESPVILEQGDDVHKLAILCEGEAIVTHKADADDRHGVERPVRIDQAPASYGAYALLSGDEEQPETVRAIGPDCLCLELNGDDFDEILSNHNNAGFVLELRREARQAGLLDRVPLLSGLNDMQKVQILHAMRAIVFQDGEILAARAAREEVFLLVVNGTVRVTDLDATEEIEGDSSSSVPAPQRSQEDLRVLHGLFAQNKVVARLALRLDAPIEHRLFSHARFATFEAGQSLWQEGDAMTGVYMVLRGQVHTSMRERIGTSGTVVPKPLGTICAGGSLGELSLLDPEHKVYTKALYTAQALCDTEVLVLDAQSFHAHCVPQDLLRQRIADVSSIEQLSCTRGEANFAAIMPLAFQIDYAHFPKDFVFSQAGDFFEPGWCHFIMSGEIGVYEYNLDRQCWEELSRLGPGEFMSIADASPTLALAAVSFVSTKKLSRATLQALDETAAAEMNQVATFRAQFRKADDVHGVRARLAAAKICLPTFVQRQGGPLQRPSIAALAASTRAKHADAQASKVKMSRLAPLFKDGKVPPDQDGSSDAGSQDLTQYPADPDLQQEQRQQQDVEAKPVWSWAALPSAEPQQDGEDSDTPHSGLTRENALGALRLVERHYSMAIEERHHATSARAKAKEPEVPGQLGPWKVERKLGSGAFSSVYEARFTLEDAQRDIINEHEWVLKASPVPPPTKRKKKGEQTPGATLLSKEYTVYRILHELPVGFKGKAYVPIPKTPKTVAWKYQYQEGGWCFLALERLGKTLSEAIASCNGHVPTDTALNVAAQLLRALQFVHGKGYIFRDVKPDNFMLGRKAADVNTLFIVDFGAVCKELSHKGVREPADPVGTPLYMSKRIHRGEPPCPRDDLESLGYMLLQMGSNELPWAAAGSEEEVLQMKESISLDELCAAVPAATLGEVAHAFLQAVLELGEDSAVPYDYLFGLLTAPLGKKVSSVEDLCKCSLSWTDSRASKPTAAAKKRTTKASTASKAAGQKTAGKEEKAAASSKTRQKVSSKTTAKAKTKKKPAATTHDVDDVNDDDVEMIDQVKTEPDRRKRAGHKSTRGARQSFDEMDSEDSDDVDDDDAAVGSSPQAEEDPDVIDLTRRMTRSMTRGQEPKDRQKARSAGAKPPKRRKGKNEDDAENEKPENAKTVKNEGVKKESMAQAAMQKATFGSRAASAAKVRV